MLRPLLNITALVTAMSLAPLAQAQGPAPPQQPHWTFEAQAPAPGCPPGDPDGHAYAAPPPPPFAYGPAPIPYGVGAPPPAFANGPAPHPRLVGRAFAPGSPAAPHSDANGDGVVTREEFMSEARRQFRYLDRDNDGRLAEDERAPAPPRRR